MKNNKVYNRFLLAACCGLAAAGTAISSVGYALTSRVFYIATIVLDITALIVSIVCFVLYEKRRDYEKPVSKYALIALVVLFLCGIVNTFDFIGKWF